MSSPLVCYQLLNPIILRRSLYLGRPSEGRQGRFMQSYRQYLGRPLHARTRCPGSYHFSRRAFGFDCWRTGAGSCRRAPLAKSSYCTQFLGIPLILPFSCAQ
eukprot:scaffold78917_cov33-Tisochrysis_lutea.AAC.9